ncbi:mannosylglucosyl-3-phosphoglycerate phosphatase-like isoform X1 [Mytilus galloprovincialis]|uniref:mannosylglucosyl-3-phosphoglycerate phosphatase-like isoform X1 n=1 Tax=Mytilus galloprovincialis TaxID=29158 RepID=UPI003F7BCA83
MSGQSLTIIHFNDVYNIEPQKDEPKGGAARMASYIKSCQELNPVVLFSGDILNPSLMSIFMKGDQMIPIVNSLNVQCAVFGNHDFDFGVDHLQEFMSKTKGCAWLLSNVIDNLSEKPLANGKRQHIIKAHGIKIGLIGLVEHEWIDTLATLDPEDVTFEDYIERGNELTRSLKEQGVDVIIALTHMRTPNDRRLAENVDDIDLILGGHDHDYSLEVVNGKNIVKSGTDFRNLSKITLTFTSSGLKVDVERVDLDSNIPEDPQIQKIVAHLNEEISEKMDEHLGFTHVDMDGRFKIIRKMETNLGNFVTDIMLEISKADCALLNSGTFRSDRIHPKGQFKLRDLLTILPLVDNLIVIECTGAEVVEALENGVSKYPALEGRFPQVAGINYGFDPTKPPGERVDPELVQIQDQYIHMNKKYLLCTKEYIADGKDGYEVFKNCPVAIDSEKLMTLSTAVRNHFESVQILQGAKKCKSGHRQSLISLVRRESLVKQASLEWHIPHQLVRQMSVHDVECEKSHLCPKVEGRIFLYDDQKREIMKMTKVEIPMSFSDEIIPEEEEEDAKQKDDGGEGSRLKVKQKLEYVDIHTL